VSVLFQQLYGTPAPARSEDPSSLLRSPPRGVPGSREHERRPVSSEAPDVSAGMRLPPRLDPQAVTGTPRDVPAA